MQAKTKSNKTRRAAVVHPVIRSYHSPYDCFLGMDFIPRQIYNWATEEETWQLTLQKSIVDFLWETNQLEVIFTEQEEIAQLTEEYINFTNRVNKRFARNLDKANPPSQKFFRLGIFNYLALRSAYRMNINALFALVKEDQSNRRLDNEVAYTSVSQLKSWKNKTVYVKDIRGLLDE